jgi:hypothetical protein
MNFTKQSCIWLVHGNALKQWSVFWHVDWIYYLLYENVAQNRRHKQKEHLRLDHFYINLQKWPPCCNSYGMMAPKLFPTPLCQAKPVATSYIYCLSNTENGTFKFSPSFSHHLKVSSNFIQLGVLLHIFICWAYECIKACSQNQSKYLLHFGPKQQKLKHQSGK